MLSNMSCSLIIHKRIKTTLAKAKALKRVVEPIINRSKNDTTHNRRMVFRNLRQKDAVTELFSIVADKISDRPGGYTRIIKLGKRLGDAAEMCFIELVDFNDIYNVDHTKRNVQEDLGELKKEEVLVETVPASDEPVAEATKSDEPAEVPADEPVAEATESDEPAAEAPESDEPVAEAPESDEPAAEAPESDEPVAEAPESDESAAKAPESDEPVAEAPESDEPVAEAPESDEPVAEAPESDEPVAEAPESDEPAAEAPESDEPVAEAPGSDEPVAEAPESDEPASETPTLDESVDNNEVEEDLDKKE